MAITQLHNSPPVPGASNIAGWKIILLTAGSVSAYEALGQCVCMQHRMALARISSGLCSFDDRTFECSTCEQLELISVAVNVALVGSRANFVRRADDGTNKAVLAFAFGGASRLSLESGHPIIRGRFSRGRFPAC